MLEVGESLKYDVKDIRGRGSYGSIVFYGLWTSDDNIKREVAVKRIQLSYIKSNSIEEFKNLFIPLSEDSKHENVLHYLDTKKDSDFLYLVTEQCTGTLEQLIRGRYNGPPVGDIDERDILLQIAKGVAHLHNKLKIIHRDIKPSNILISCSTSNTKIDRKTTALFKIADLGIISTLITDERDFKKKKTYVDPHGTHGWMAPEMFDSDNSGYDFSVDIFALGCLFGYTLSGGKHPFGDSPLEQSMGILEKNEMRLAGSDFERCCSKDSTAAIIKLIRSMISMNPIERPTIDVVLNDPFFSVYDNDAGSDEITASSLTTISGQKGNNDVFGPYKEIIDQVFSKGLIVFSGLYNDKPVAISRINIRKTLIQIHDTNGMFNKETRELRERKTAINDYFAKILDSKISTNFGFIVTAMWDATLEDYIEERCQRSIKFKDPREILLPVTKGLEYLHSSIRSPHGNIGPKTIFIYQKSDGVMSVKISDLATSAALEKISNSSLHEDILALGRLFAYIFSIERNKYYLDEDDGIGLRRTLKKLSNKLPSSKHFTEHITSINEKELLELITLMVDRNPEKRPRIGKILSDGFFSDYERSKPSQDITDDSVLQHIADLSLEKSDSSSSSTTMEEAHTEEMQNSKEEMEPEVGESLKYDAKDILGQGSFAGSADESTLAQTRQKSGVIQQRVQEAENKEVGSIKFEKEKDIVVGASSFTYKLSDWIKSENRPFNTPVFKGKLNGNIPIALKRYQKMDESATKQMIKELEVLSLPENSRFVRYFGHVEDEYFSYIATELCECSVADIIDPKRKVTAREKIPLFDTIADRFSHREILRQSSEAVSFLHGLGMIHRNIHPDNFLIACVDPNKDYFLIKLTDFKLSKSIEKNPENTGTYNEEGWVAPESFKGKIKLNYKVDAFILGCYYFYVLSGGKHPFGRGVFEQRTRISDENDKVYQDSWDGRPEWDIGSTHTKQENMKMALEIVKDVIKFDPKKRKFVDDVLKNKYFQASGRSSKKGLGAIASRDKFVDLQYPRLVGELSYDRENVVDSRGCYSTVFRGFFRKSLPVAVNRKPRRFIHYSKYMKQLKLLQFTPHPNILRCFCTEEDYDFIYIAVELCSGTLQDYVEGKYQGPKFKDEREILYQLTNGVAYLHKNNIVHRDINPTNILVYLANGGSKAQIKMNIPSIGEMAREEDFHLMTNQRGIRGWMAPEMYRLERDYSKVDIDMDIFPLGCIFAYTLSGGKHPFGDDDLVKRSVRIKMNSNMLLTIKDLKMPYCDDILAFELIQSMLEIESSKRPSAEYILKHVFFKGLNVVETAKAATSVLKKLDDHLSYYFGSSTEHLLGQGGFAFVFLGLWRDPLGGNDAKEKKVAVKRIQRDPIQQSNFQKEVDHLLKVKGHPNILRCFATKMDDFFLYIVTELCNGTLKEWMEGKYQGPPIGDERNILFQITIGLAYLHGNGIVHRDIKPSNILISIPEVEGSEPLMKLSDFGISGVLIKEKGFTNTDKHSSLGTRGYIAPEMYESNHYDFKVDIYALGVVFGQVLSKERKNPFASTIRAEGSVMILELDDFKEPYSIDGLAFELIQSMGNVKPEKRPTAQEILEHIFFRPLNFNVAHAASIKEPMDSNFGK